MTVATHTNPTATVRRLMDLLLQVEKGRAKRVAVRETQPVYAGYYLEIAGYSLGLEWTHHKHTSSPSLFSNWFFEGSVLSFSNEEQRSEIDDHAAFKYWDTFQKRDLNEVLGDLVTLSREPEQDEFGILRPTDHAFRTALDLCITAARFMSSEFPYGAVAPDGDGGIRIEWEEGDRNVRLIVSAEPEVAPQVYIEQGDMYELEDCISPNHLASLLEWLLKQ